LDNGWFFHIHKPECIIYHIQKYEYDKCHVFLGYRSPYVEGVPQESLNSAYGGFASGSGTKNQAKTKAFLQWLVSSDRATHYDNILPGHTIPPLKSVRQETLVNLFVYTPHYADWIQSIYDWSAFTTHPAMNMSASNGQFKRSNIALP
jgi:ABC-type glycerol-3-phosphate transport system substrate-binding protein